MREESGNTGMTAGTQDSRNTRMPPGTPQARLPAPHVPPRETPPGRPAPDVCYARGAPGLESASACGLGAEGPVRSGLFDEADVADGDLFADFLGQESLDPTRGLEVSLGRADRGHD